MCAHTVTLQSTVGVTWEHIGLDTHINKQTILNPTYNRVRWENIFKYILMHFSQLWKEYRKSVLKWKYCYITTGAQRRHYLYLYLSLYMCFDRRPDMGLVCIATQSHVNLGQCCIFYPYTDFFSLSLSSILFLTTKLTFMNLTPPSALSLGDIEQ